MPSPAHRLRPRQNTRPRKPLAKVRSFEHYRSVHEREELRLYSNIGDPIRDREVLAQRWRMVVVLICLVFALALVVFMVRGR